MRKKISIREVTAALRKTPPFRDLDGEALRHLATQAIVRHYKPGAVLFFAGDDPGGLFVMAKGVVRGFRTVGDGREQIIFVERAPATLAEAPVFDGGDHYATAVAEEDALVYCFEKAVIRDLCLENPAFALEGLRVLGQRVRSLAALVEELTLHGVAARLARFLLHEADRHGETVNGEIHLELNLTRAQIAARIGSVREVVSRNFGVLKSENLIRFENRRLIICDREKLARYAAASAEKD